MPQASGRPVLPSTLLLIQCILSLGAQAAPLALKARTNAVVNVLPSGNVTVVNADTDLPITQGPATDGAGSGFSPPAIVWIVFALALGPPLAFAGIRGGRVTTAAALGLAGALAAWSSIVNTIGASGLDDLALTFIVLGFFAAMFLAGLWSWLRIPSIAILAVLGGLSVGVRADLMRSGLLVGVYIADWILIGALGAVFGVLMIYHHRASILLSSAAIGSFLVALGIDLIINQQSGMSTGLRFLFDRNSSHLAFIFQNGYHVEPNTQITLAASLGAVPLLALVQHKMFPQPFWKPAQPEDENALPNIVDEKPFSQPIPRVNMVSGLFQNFRSTLYGKPQSRFSL